MPHSLPSETKPGLVVHPLGGWVCRVASQRPGRARSIAVVVLVACTAILGVAIFLKPSDAGLGSHQKLGLPPCITIMLWGVPCPTCGMTTAFAHTVRGQLGGAFMAQPAGLVLALGTMAAAGMSLMVMFTGKVWVVNWYRVHPMAIGIFVVVLILGGWAFKIAVAILSGTLTFG